LPASRLILASLLLTAAVAPAGESNWRLVWQGPDVNLLGAPSEEVWILDHAAETKLAVDR
jgi:hypothetical protein